MKPGALMPAWLREWRRQQNDTRDVENALSSHLDRLRHLTVELEEVVAGVKSSGGVVE